MRANRAHICTCNEGEKQKTREPREAAESERKLDTAHTHAAGKSRGNRADTSRNFFASRKAIFKSASRSGRRLNAN